MCGCYNTFDHNDNVHLHGLTDWTELPRFGWNWHYHGDDSNRLRVDRNVQRIVDYSECFEWDGKWNGFLHRRAKHWSSSVRCNYHRWQIGNDFARRGHSYTDVHLHGLTDKSELPGIGWNWHGRSDDSIRVFVDVNVQRIVDHCLRFW